MDTDTPNNKPDSSRSISNGVDLSQKRCVPCEGGVAPFSRPESEGLLKQTSGWSLSKDAKKISRTFKFKDFSEAMQFANKVAAVAEAEGHHPDLHISWGKVIAELTTHAIEGLSENDFILAAKIDRVS